MSALSHTDASYFYSQPQVPHLLNVTVPTGDPVEVGLASILPAGEGARDEARMGRDLASDFRAGEVFAAVDVVQVTGPRAMSLGI